VELWDHFLVVRWTDYPSSYSLLDFLATCTHIASATEHFSQTWAHNSPFSSRCASNRLLQRYCYPLAENQIEPVPVQQFYYFARQQRPLFGRNDFLNLASHALHLSALTAFETGPLFVLLWIVEASSNGTWSLQLDYCHCHLQQTQPRIDSRQRSTGKQRQFSGWEKNVRTRNNV